MKMDTEVIVRYTQRIGEILMNKKLAFIMTFVLIILGATRIISTHNIEAENVEEPSVLNSLIVQQLVQKESLHHGNLNKQPVVQKNLLISVKESTITDEQPKIELLSHSLNSRPIGGTVAESVDGFMPYVEQLIFDKVNEERKKVGIDPLKNDPIMNQYAKTKSKDMGDRQYFSHENPEGNLMNVFMQQDGIQYQAWGENIAYISGDVNESLEIIAEQFMSNWMNSKGHRENILSTNFKSLGIGVYRVGNKIYATQEFYR